MTQKETAMTLDDIFAVLLIPGFLAIVGTCGNFMSGVIMLRQRFIKLSVGVYLMFLAVADTIAVWTTYPGAKFLLAISGFDLFKHSEQSCKLTAYVYFASTYVSSWMIAGMAVERSIAVAIPHKAKIYCSR